MSDGTVSVRYARALLRHAEECGTGASVYAEMQKLALSLRAVPDLLHCLEDPTVQVADKLRLLETAVDKDGAVSVPLKDFFRLVTERERTGLMPFMASSYIDMYRAAHGILAVRLVTAVELGADRLDRLRKLVEERLDCKQIEWDCQVDASIKGGFILEADGNRLDASVRSRLQLIRKELIDKNNRVI